MYYKYLTIFSIFVLVNSKLLACCESPNITVFPYTSNISANSIFLVGVPASNFPAKKGGKFDKFLFFAVNNHGKKQKLSIIEPNHQNSFAQLWLKSGSVFGVGDSISLAVTLIDTSDIDTTKAKDFIRQVSSRKWKVISPQDKKAPRWTNAPITSEILDDRATSVHGFGIRFNVPIFDNSFKELEIEQYGQKFFPLLYEVSLGNQKVILDSFQHSFTLYQSICGRFFNVVPNQIYTISIRAIDSSGNYSSACNTSFCINLPPIRWW
jgi:hypothetical protein